jgi:hypothetical protein
VIRLAELSWERRSLEVAPQNSAAQRGWYAFAIGVAPLRATGAVFNKSLAWGRLVQPADSPSVIARWDNVAVRLPNLAWRHSRSWVSKIQWDALTHGRFATESTKGARAEKPRTRHPHSDTRIRPGRPISVCNHTSRATVSQLTSIVPSAVGKWNVVSCIGVCARCRKRQFAMCTRWACPVSRGC